MTLMLALNTKPENLGVKTYPSDPMIDRILGTNGASVYIGAVGIAMSEFLCAVERSLLKGSITSDSDPRLVFVERIRGASKVPGYDERGELLSIPSSPAYSETAGFEIAARLGSYEISLIDLLLAAEYVLENTNLMGAADPRETFVAGIRLLELKEEGNAKKFVSLREDSLVASVFPPRPDLTRAPTIHWIGDTNPSEGLLVARSMGAMNVALSKQVMKKKASIKLGVRDVLRTSNFSGYSRYADVDLKVANDQRKDNRVYSISFNYKFGKSNIAPERNRRGGAGEEQSRVKSGG